MHNKIKLPDIESKPNSSSKHNRPNAVTAKAWLYWTPNYQYGKNLIIQDSRQI